MTKDPNDYEYEYDYENRLIKITKNSGVTAVAEFEYDALGRRIEVYDNIADETTRYYYDGWRVLAEMDENGTQKRKYIYGNYLDEVLVKIEDDAEIYYAHNHLYSPVALVDDNGNVVERYEYNAYGQRTIWDSTFSSQRTSSSYNNPISFTGQRLDTYDNGSLPNMYYKYRNLGFDTK